MTIAAYVPPEGYPLRRKVAMAYRNAREADEDHHVAYAAALAVYFEERPDELADKLAATGRVAQMLSSAINENPVWFWKNVRAMIEVTGSQSR